MTVCHELWLPILLSAAFVFVASFILHMALPWHRGDYAKIPDEDKVMDALRPFGIPPGDYMFPMCGGPKDVKSPEFAEKMKKGPVAVVTIMPNACFGMGKSLALWFLYLLVVSFFGAYVACHALPAGAPAHRVTRLVGVTAFLGYAAALWQMSIWYRRSWITTIKATIDGIIYAAITAAVFVWLWPH